MTQVKRIYVEKKPEYAVAAKELLENIHSYLNIQSVTGVRVLIRYDIENITNPALYADYRGEIVADRYGRKIPKHAHGTVNLKTRTSSSRKIMEAVMGLYDDIVNPKLLVRRITLVGNRQVEEDRAEADEQYEQLELFTDTRGQEEEKKQEELRLKKERSLQEAMLSVKKKYGKNAMLKGMNLQEGATAMERNSQF